MPVKTSDLLCGLALLTLASAGQADPIATDATGGGVAFSNYQPSLVLSQGIAPQGVYPSSGSTQSMTTIGMVHSFAGPYMPFEIVAADGQFRSVPSDPLLWSVVGQNYGTALDQFAVPDLVGRTAIGRGTGPGLPGFALADTTGLAAITLGTANLPSHEHVLAPATPTSSVGGNAAFTNYQPSLAMTYMIATEINRPQSGNPAPRAMLGEVALFGGDFAPAGWIEADGRLLSKSAYADLFGLIGTTYGGDGITSFALPDLRGRAIVGTGTGPGLDEILLGEFVGAPTVTLSESQMPAHDHGVPGFGITDSAGAGDPFDTYQPGLGLNYLIATSGAFPTFGAGDGVVPQYQHFLGEVIAFTGSFVPHGWMAADGRLLSISAYGTLFSILGTTYGGDGITSFALPDLRGRVVVGSGAGFDPGTLLGSPSTALTTANLAPHSHMISPPAPVPEPASWATMIAGLALAGGLMRARRPRCAIRFA
jgi:microcystin-dependent protein